MQKQDNPENHKHVLSLETLKDFTDFGKEEVSVCRDCAQYLDWLTLCIYAFW